MNNYFYFLMGKAGISESRVKARQAGRAAGYGRLTALQQDVPLLLLSGFFPPRRAGSSAAVRGAASPPDHAIPRR